MKTATDPTALRCQLRAAGYSPLPLYGKTPPVYNKKRRNNRHGGLADWQNLHDPSPEQIKMWERTWPDAANTGCLTRLMPTIDIDIKNLEAAEAIEALARERFEERGYVLVRIGMAPKRAIPLRTDVPFGKITGNIIAPDGSEQKVELLGDGQQLVVAGIHPDTGKPYAWHGGNPGPVKLEELPYVSQAEAQAFIEDAVALLIEQHGYQLKPTAKKRHQSNGQDDGADWSGFVGNLIDHDELARFAMSLLRSGMKDGAAVNFLRCSVRALQGVDPDRKQRRLEEIPDLVSSASAKIDKEVQPPTKATKAKRVAVLVRGDRVPLKSVRWAWKHRLAFGKLALIAGDPGLGKSQIALDIVARVTTGDYWPVDGGRAQVAEAIVLTAEDGLSDTVAPRLVAAGADMSKVHFLKGTKVGGGDEELFDLTRDVEALREVLAQNPAIKIIVIDPVTAYLGETQAQRNAQVRKALAPLVRLIEDTGVLVIGITHLNKSQGKAIYRVLDSIAFVALGRILHLVIADAENPGNCKFICDKTNIGPKPPGLTYICQQVPIATEDGEEWVSRICWGTSHINETADQALSAETASTEGTTAKDDAIEFLRKVLAHGPVGVKEIECDARAAGLLSEEQRLSQSKPFRSARKALGIEPDKLAMDEGWVWALPKMPSNPEGALSKPEGIFGVGGHLRDNAAQPATARESATPKPVRPKLAPVTPVEMPDLPAFLDRRLNGLGQSALGPGGPDDDMGYLAGGTR